MLHNKKLFFAAFLLVAGISINLSVSTYADTGVEADGSATITFHVLSSDGTDATPDNNTATDPDADPTEYVDDETTDDSGDERDDLSLEDDTAGEDGDEDSDITGVDDADPVESSDASDAGSTAAAAAGTAAAASNNDSGGDDTDDATGATGTPDTGVVSDAAEGSSFSLTPIILTVAGALIMALVIKVIKDEHSSRIYRNLHRDFRFQLGDLKFKHEHSRRISPTRIAQLAVIPSLAVFAGVVFLANNSPAETEAASAYPYTISLENGGTYDVYVKQGEFARASFNLKTTTNNPTGYTLTMATDTQTLGGPSTDTVESTSSELAPTALADNTWGFSTNGTKYSRVPNTRSAGATLRQTSGASASGNSSVVYFGMKAGADLPAGDYTATIRFAARTNLVTKKLKLANGNVATVKRVSDGTTLKNNAQIYVGEELEVANAADVAGITQTATVNDTTFTGSKKITVTKNVNVSTSDDSIHFLKNTLFFKEDTGGYGSNGDAILIKSQGKYWLVDAGHTQSKTEWLNGGKVAAYLKELGVNKLDYVLFTHAHGDHMGGVKKLISKGYIRDTTTVYMRGCRAVQDKYSSAAEYGKSYPDLRSSCEGRVDALKAAGVNLVDFYNHESERAALKSKGIDFGNFHIDFYNIDQDSSTGKISYDRYRENLNSIGMKLTHTPSGKTTFLAGDFEYGNEAKYGSKIGKVDILKAGHHGAKTSNTHDFYQKLNPSTVVVTSVDVAMSDGTPARQEAAWAYVQQQGGSVYFTGSSTGDAVAINFTSKGYTVKKGKKKDVNTDASTGSKKASYDGGKSYYAWNGGVYAWTRPYSKVGEGGDAVYWNWTTTSAHSKTGKNEYYVYVYKSKTGGNVIRQTDLCTGGYQYNFSYDLGAAKGRTKASC